MKNYNDSDFSTQTPWTMLQTANMHLMDDDTEARKEYADACDRLAADYRTAGDNERADNLAWIASNYRKPKVG